MTQPFEIVAQFDERPEAGKPRDLALNDIAGLVRGDKVVPRIWFEVLNRERHPPVLGIDAGDHGIDLLTFLEHFARMLDAARPRNIRDMHEAVHAIFNFDEGPEVCQVANSSMNSSANLITVTKRHPGIGLNLLHPQTDSSGLRINAEHFDFNRVAGPDQLAGMLHALRPAHFRNVHQTFNARLQLNERAIVGNARDLAV